MQKNKRFASTKAIACCALLAALSIVMARLLSFSTPGVRWSLDKFPLFLAGMLFGPMFGAMTGFTADLIGSLMQMGFNPALCPPAILYGVFGGLFSMFIARKPSLLRVAISYAFPVVLGSILYQSVALAYFYPKGPYMVSLIYFLSSRSFQFALFFVAEVLIIFTLLKMRVFSRMGLWPKK